MALQESDREGSPTPRQSPVPELVVPPPVSHRLTTPDTDRLRPSAFASASASAAPPTTGLAAGGFTGTTGGAAAAKQTLTTGGTGTSAGGVEGSPSASALTSTSDQRSSDADDDYAKDLVRLHLSLIS